MQHAHSMHGGLAKCAHARRRLLMLLICALALAIPLTGAAFPCLPVLQGGALHPGRSPRAAPLRPAPLPCQPAGWPACGNRHAPEVHRPSRGADPARVHAGASGKAPALTPTGLLGAAVALPAALLGCETRMPSRAWAGARAVGQCVPAMPALPTLPEVQHSEVLTMPGPGLGPICRAWATCPQSGWSCCLRLGDVCGGWATSR